MGKNSNMRDNTEFKMKVSLFSRVSKKRKATPQTEWWSLITRGRETPSSSRGLYVYLVSIENFLLWGTSAR